MNCKQNFTCVEGKHRIYFSIDCAKNIYDIVLENGKYEYWINGEIAPKNKMHTMIEHYFNLKI